MVDSSMSKLIAAFVLLIIGIVLVAQVATIGLEVTGKVGKINDSVISPAAGYAGGGEMNTSYVHTVTNNPTSWKVDDCPLTNIILTNSSGYTYAETTDYVFTDSTGTFTLVSTKEVNSSLISDNATYVSYVYCGDDYMNLGWGRTGINLVPGFFALALLLASIGLFYSIAKENGIIN